MARFRLDRARRRRRDAVAGAVETAAAAAADDDDASVARVRAAARVLQPRELRVWASLRGRGDAKTGEAGEAIARPS